MYTVSSLFCFKKPSIFPTSILSVSAILLKIVFCFYFFIQNLICFNTYCVRMVILAVENCYLKYPLLVVAHCFQPHERYSKRRIFLKFNLHCTTPYVLPEPNMSFNAYNIFSILIYLAKAFDFIMLRSEPLFANLNLTLTFFYFIIFIVLHVKIFYLIFA